MEVAKRGNIVKVHYKGTLCDGTVFDSSEGKEPLEFAIGSGEVIDGFEEAILGMAVGEKKDVHIPVDKAYGVRNEDLVMTVPMDQVPEDLNAVVGDRLEVGAPDGDIMRVVVIEVNDEHMILDGNPPLAGMDLNFSLELVDCKY